MRRAAFALVALSLALFAARFARLDLAPFVHDEAYLLFAARDGGFANASPIPGSRGFRYGPAPTWFYAAAPGESPRASIAALCAAVTLAQIALLFALARANAGGPLLFATLGALVASSPYLFFWSRTAWDNPLAGACAALAVAVLAGKEPWRAASLVALGAALGFALATHPLAVPLAVVVVVALAVERPPEIPRIALLAGLPALAILAPWLLHLARAIPEASAAVTGGESAGPLRFAAEIARVASTAGIGYFFEEGGLFGVAAGIAIATALGAAAVAGLALTIRGEGPCARIARVALALAIVQPAFLALQRLPPHPHYQQATWWIVPAGIAALLARLPAGRARAVGHVAVWAVAISQIAFVASWMRLVDSRGGTRGLRYGATVGEQERALDNACANAPASFVLLNRTDVVPPSLAYLAATRPACADKEVRLCHRACPSGEPDFVIEYAGDDVARLAVTSPRPR